MYPLKVKVGNQESYVIRLLVDVVWDTQSNSAHGVVINGEGEFLTVPMNDMVIHEEEVKKKKIKVDECTPADLDAERRRR